MIIGIDASRAFIKKRTGIEEYSYQVIKHLMNKLDGHKVILYVRKNSKFEIRNKFKIPNPKFQTNFKFQISNFKLPNNWRIKVIKWPRFWTQIGLSLELLFNPVDVLFVPAHTVPIIHSSNTIVTIHGLEYETFPETYSAWERFYMRWSIKNSCRWAKRIIAVSQNTKKDLMKFYKMPEEKITVIYEGYGPDRKSQIPNTKSQTNSKFQIPNSKYLFFVGRLEKRKNIIGIIKAFEILKEKYNIPHKLILAGKPGYGFDSIKYQVKCSKYKEDIILTGYVSEEEKWKLLKNADVFLFPTLYEGFGIPVLEAQSVGTPVVAGNNSSIPEISTNYEFYETTNLRRCHSEFNLESKEISDQAQNDSSSYSVLLVDSNSPQEIAETSYKLISDENLKNDIINKGYENVKRFSWDKCSREIAELLK